MDIMRVLAVVAILLLAGCLGLDPGRKDPPGQDPTPTAPEPTQAPRPEPSEPVEPGRIPMLLDFGYRNCTGYDSTWLVPIGQVLDQLPEGFAPLIVSGQLEGFGEVQFKFLQCDFVTAAGSIEDIVLGWVAVTLKDGDRYLLRMLSDAILEQLWDAAGYPLYTGEYTATGQAVPLASLEPGIQDMAFGDYAFQGLTAQAGTPNEADRTYVTLTDEGLLEWEMTQRIDQTVALAGSLATPGDVFTLEATDALEAEQQRIQAEYDVDLWLTP